MKNRKGFTLIELLAVIVILAIILLIAVPQVTQIINKSKKDAFIASYKMVLKQIDYNALQGETIISTEAADYDLESASYTLTIAQSTTFGTNGAYTVTLVPIGDFENIDLNANVACSEITGYVENTCTSTTAGGIVADYIPAVSD